MRANRPGLATGARLENTGAGATASTSTSSRTGAGFGGRTAVTAGMSGTLICALVSECTASLRGVVRW